MVPAVWLISAHSPNFEEADRAGQIMRDDVLNAAVRLADG